MMMRVRLILSLALVLTLMLATGATVFGQSVQGGPAAKVEIVAVPGNVSLSADPGDTATDSSTGIQIKANKAYDVECQADKAKMTEYDTTGSTYGSVTLTNDLSVTLGGDGSTGAKTSTTLNAAATDMVSAASKTGGTGRTHTVTFSQPMDWNDTVAGELSSGDTYRIELTWTASAH